MKILTTKLLVLIMSMAVVMTSTAYAGENKHDHKSEFNIDSHKENVDMQKMHEHMKLMEEQMSAIRSETNLDIRKKLMRGHRQSIREGMKMMMQDTSNEGLMTKKKEEIHAAMKREGKMESHGRIENMEEHLDLMQQMMEQMMNHQNELYELYEEYRNLERDLGS